MKRNKFLIIAIYVLFIVSFLSVSYTLGKYVSNQSVGGSFEIGDQLYFDYTRSDLYRNDQLIVGVIVNEPNSNKTYITTDNVSPGDNVRYHFYISNFDLETGKMNGYDANFLPVSTALLNMPIKGSSFDLDATIYYRVIPLDQETGEPDPNNKPSTVYSMIAKDTKLDLPEDEKVMYEFYVEVLLDEQMSNTDHNDYFGATLSIEMYFNAVSKIKNN